MVPRSFPSLDPTRRSGRTNSAFLARRARTTPCMWLRVGSRFGATAREYGGWYRLVLCSRFARCVSGSGYGEGLRNTRGRPEIGKILGGP